jgi:hypothetical protein
VTKCLSGLPHITLNAGMHVTGAVCMSVTFVIAQSLNSNVSFWDFSPEYIWTFVYSFFSNDIIQSTIHRHSLENNVSADPILF